MSDEPMNEYMKAREGVLRILGEAMEAAYQSGRMKEDIQEDCKELFANSKYSTILEAVGLITGEKAHLPSAAIEGLLGPEAREHFLRFLITHTAFAAWGAARDGGMSVEDMMYTLTNQSLQEGAAIARREAEENDNDTSEG